jgi:hypothetical protein
MVETAVVMAPLTPEMVEQGAELVRALEKEGVTIRAAFWFLNIETGAWRLFIGTPDVTRIGWGELYGIARPLWKKLADHPAFYLDEVGIPPETESVFTLLSGLLTTGPDFPGRRFTNTGANGRPIDDVYVYKQTIEPPPPPGRRRRSKAA